MEATAPHVSNEPQFFRSVTFHALFRYNQIRYWIEDTKYVSVMILP